MDRSRAHDARQASRSLSLDDLEQLWGEGGQHASASDGARARYLANECPWPSSQPENQPAEEQIWHRPPCA